MIPICPIHDMRMNQLGQTINYECPHRLCKLLFSPDLSYCYFRKGQQHCPREYFSMFGMVCEKNQVEHGRLGLAEISDDGRWTWRCTAQGCDFGIESQPGEWQVYFRVAQILGGKETLKVPDGWSRPEGPN